MLSYVSSLVYPFVSSYFPVCPLPMPLCQHQWFLNCTQTAMQGCFAATVWRIQEQNLPIAAVTLNIQSSKTAPHEVGFPCLAVITCYWKSYVGVSEREEHVSGALSSWYENTVFVIRLRLHTCITPGNNRHRRRPLPDLIILLLLPSLKKKKIMYTVFSQHICDTPHCQYAWICTRANLPAY